MFLSLDIAHQSNRTHDHSTQCPEHWRSTPPFRLLGTPSQVSVMPLASDSARRFAGGRLAALSVILEASSGHGDNLQVDDLTQNHGIMPLPPVSKVH